MGAVMEQATREKLSALAGLPNKGPLTGRMSEVALAYQRMLACDPQNPEALVGMGLIALASGQTEHAIKMTQAGVMAAPGMRPAWVALGQALKAAGRMDEAEEAYLHAIRMDGVDVLARLGLGELRIAQDRATDALAEFELARRREPGMAAARMGMGNALAMLGRYQESLEEYEITLGLSPKLPEAEFAAGFSLMRMGRYEEAGQRFRMAVKARPDFAAAWLNLGCLEREMGREIYAEAALKRAVELRPDLANAWLNLGLVERERKNSAKAEKYMRKALELRPDSADTHVAWCQFRAGEEDFVGAWSWLRWALWRVPNHPEGLNMMGILLHRAQRYEEAVEAFTRAEAVGHRAAASNHGNTLLDLGRAEEALVAHKRAAELDPESSGAKYNLALTRLRLGQWKEGWPEYEARWHFRQVHKHPRLFRQPRWQGEDLNGRGVLLHAEQGLGDTIQFGRYAELVAERGGMPVLLVQDAAERLMRSLPVVQKGLATVGRAGEQATGFELECPLMSMPAVFGTTVETTPWRGAYLGADSEAVQAKWRAFPALGVGPRVGFAWSGNPNYKADAQRSTTVRTLLPMLRRPGFEWISLQKGEAAAQLAALPKDLCVVDGSSCERDLAETAALIATLDLVVTTDTCVAHLAGAMAKPVWILLPFLSDWRWMQERETTPWYPTARLLRQMKPDDWAGLLERAIVELDAFRQGTAWGGPLVESCGSIFAGERTA